MVDAAKEVGVDAVSHGCTGKGNDQVQFELKFFALHPELQVVASWREWEIIGREDAIEYAKKHGVTVPVPVPVSKKSIYSRDMNLWHLSHEEMVDAAKEVGVDAVSHGCTGKYNDQFRFEMTSFALHPELQVMASWREWEITR